MFRKIITFPTFFICQLFSFAGDNNIGARSAGMGNSSVTLSDVWSTGNNQAGLAYLKSISAGVCYDDRFLLLGLGLKGAAIAIPTKAGVFGISTIAFGNKLYSENKYGLAFSKTFGPAVSAGVQLDYLNTKIAEGYGSVGAPVMEMGVQVKLTKQLTLGSHLFNPTRAKLADYNNERIPTFMRFGFAYIFSEKVFIDAEIQKDILFKPLFKFGLEYNPKKEFYLRTGFSTDPAKSTFGFGVLIKKIKFDLASSFDSVLGFTPNAGLIYIVE